MSKINPPFQLITGPIPNKIFQTVLREAAMVDFWILFQFVENFSLKSEYFEATVLDMWK